MHSGLTLHSVQDGDTLTILWQPKQPHQQRVRLASIDAPERGEILYAESREVLARLARGDNLRLEPLDARGWTPGPYNRITCHVYTDTGWLNHEMIRTGYAVVWPQDRYDPHEPTLLYAQIEARSHRRGVWGLDNHRLHEMASTRLKTRPLTRMLL